MTEYEEKIKELDAIINLYKDDAADGLRNKIWAWTSTLIQESNKDALRDFVDWVDREEKMGYEDTIRLEQLHQFLSTKSDSTNLTDKEQ